MRAGLIVEDYGVQPMDNASPPKWHLAHTSMVFRDVFAEALSATITNPISPRSLRVRSSIPTTTVSGKPYPRPKPGAAVPAYLWMRSMTTDDMWIDAMA